jgi:hypothetical protein
MSVMNHRGEKIVLARGGIDQFWFDVLRYYGRHNDKRWRALAMLALRVNGRWPLECIARTFGLERRHVAAYLMRIRRDLREQFEVPASVLMDPHTAKSPRCQPNAPPDVAAESTDKPPPMDRPRRRRRRRARRADRTNPHQ